MHQRRPQGSEAGAPPTNARPIFHKLEPPAAESQSWAESHNSYRVDIVFAQDYDSHNQLTTLGKQGCEVGGEV